MDFLIVFNNGKALQNKYELTGIYDKSQYELFFNDEDSICILVDYYNLEKIKKSIECDYSVFYSKEKKDFLILKKPYNCSVWNGYSFETELAEAKEELNKLVNFRLSDKKTLLDKTMQISFYLERFNLLKNKNEKVELFSKYFTRKELESFYEYTFNDLKEIIDKIDRAKEAISKLTKEDFLKKKEEIILNLTLNYVKKDFEFGDLSLEDVKLYYKLFIENLKNLPYKVKFIPVNQIKDNGFYIDEHLNAYTYSAEKNNNHYMKNIKIEKLAMDIFKNGTYWALFALQICNNKYEIIEGNFRLGSIKSAILDEKIPRDFKMLTVTNEISKKFEKAKVFLPYVEDLEAMKNHPYYKFLYRCPDLKLDESGKFFIATFERDYIVTYGSSFVANCINVFGIGLNNYVFKYKLSPKDLEGNEYINDLKYEGFWEKRDF